MFLKLFLGPISRVINNKSVRQSPLVYGFDQIQILLENMKPELHLHAFIPLLVPVSKTGEVESMASVAKDLEDRGVKVTEAIGDQSDQIGVVKD
ncbi:hypothetical protein SLEP1_g30212 [Rubroshorea leprosula]|uniref:Uncharacterized protein n=1 Tax=Rubroshorea leprosula TaxID=152421 RepID=A0AAV5JZD4_9ROSI|nr:hypothetical protein SLEP1_g30212 [Rubroshorea leprosula]